VSECTPMLVYDSDDNDKPCMRGYIAHVSE